jgi:iron complex outermembrane recepter protein
MRARHTGRHMLKLESCIVMLAVLLAPASTVAETADAPAASSPTQLQEVIVTALKRKEALLSVPASVTSLSASALVSQGAVSLTDYAASVPGLNLISSQRGQTLVMMRGITSGTGAALPATTSTYINDVPYGSSTANAYGAIATLDLDPAVLQRVEVLRGPQGTLYGASSLGGLIKYVTAPPSLTNYSAQIELDGSAIDGGALGGGARAMMDGPLIKDTLGINISGFDRLDPGYIDDPRKRKNNVNSSRADGGLIDLLWRPTERFSARLSVLAQDVKTPNTSNVDMNADLTPIYGKYQQVRYVDENWDFYSRLYSLTANYEFGPFTLTSITSYATRDARWDIDVTNKFGSLLSTILGVPNLAGYDLITLANQKTTQEVRLSSSANDTLEWLAGFFFTHEHSIKPEDFEDPFSALTGVITPVPEGLFTDTLDDSYTEYAGYGDVTLHLTSKLKILGGLRFGTDSEKSVTPFSGLFFGPPTVDVGNSSDHNLTYLVSPSYNLDNNNMIYIRVASGFQPGGPTGVSSSDLIKGAPETYKPSSVVSYEAGYKASLLAQRMTIELAGFDIEWKDIQVLVDTGGFLVTGNGASARSAGAELEWAWRPIGGLTVSANAAYTRAYLTSDAPAIGGTSGQDLPNVPTFAANLTADYDFPLTGQLDGFVGGSFQYEGSRPIGFISGAPATFVPPVMPQYNTGNLRAGVGRGGFGFEAYVKNVGNSYGITQLVSQVRNAYGPPLAGSVIQPRTFGISISQKF